MELLCKLRRARERARVARELFVGIGGVDGKL